ncbi:adhesion G-protein coupled receptor G1-like [Centropristis striata]|uniref:adhesion G-protein coupled receptor G1-like n=1 Tax=Centropristis striata TaxID=184440 RepID=UPI0027E1FEA8|nr:adhesion G-protein coupled receptor G1-like [Centropristis striata]
MLRHGDCRQHQVGCYEDKIRGCKLRGRFAPNIRVLQVSWSEEAEAEPTLQHRVHIPSSALLRSRGASSEKTARVVAHVISSTYFKLLTPLSPPQRKGRMGPVLPVLPEPPVQRQGTVLGGLVLAVKAGNQPVKNLTEPIQLSFKHNTSQQKEKGECVFWQATNDGAGFWSTEGCETKNTGTEFICSCNHLSFFAVLVNPVLSVEERNAVALSYITYIGSAFSIFFTVLSLIIYICLQRVRPEKAIGVHLHLTAAVFCLHLGFLLCSFWIWNTKESEEGWVCQGLGFFLHWSLLATFCWTALEGFHLYLLLVRVFNIYIRKYLLKLSLVGWGIPTLIAVVCGILGVYGKYSVEVIDASNNSTAQICWLSSKFPHRLLVSYVTTLAFPCLVVLCNSIMLGVVVVKLWGLRAAQQGIESSSGWKKMNKEKASKLWKDSATVLGLSCVLGLPWGLASITYISLPGIYIFTILTSLQGVFLFLWSLALTYKSRSDNNSSVRDPSSQKVMTTSF